MHGPKYEYGSVYIQPFGLRKKDSDSQSYCPQNISSLPTAIWFSSFHSKNLENTIGGVSLSPNDSTNVSFFRSVFFLLKMEIFPNNFSQFSCLSRYYNLKHPLDCLVHISHPFCDHRGANLQVS